MNGRDFLRVIQDAYDQLDGNGNPCLPATTFHAKLTASYSEDHSPELPSAESSSSRKAIGMPSLDAAGMYIPCNNNDPTNIEQTPSGTTYSQAFGSGLAPSYLELVYPPFVATPETDSKSPAGGDRGSGEGPYPHDSCR